MLLNFNVFRNYESKFFNLLKLYNNDKMYVTDGIKIIRI